MSRRVTVRVEVTRGRKGRRRLERAAPKPEPPERVPRVARLLALAHHWRGLIRDGTVRDQTDLARVVGVTRARVSQVMRLLGLAPDIQEAVLDGRVDGPGAELALRATAEEAVWERQRPAFESCAQSRGSRARASSRTSSHSTPDRCPPSSS